MCKTVNYKVINVEQGSPEWRQCRVGLWTASFFEKALSNSGNLSKQAEDVVNRLVAERIMEEPTETFQSDAMKRGVELEKEAFNFINFTQGMNFETVGFIDSELGFGASPDGWDEKAGIGLELKVPAPHTHIGYISAGVFPKKYTAQVQGSMMVTGFKKWMFCSYHPIIKPLVVIVERDEVYIAKLRQVLIGYCAEIERRYQNLKDNYREG